MIEKGKDERIRYELFDDVCNGREVLKVVLSGVKKRF